jgi:hypothetical protein
MIGFESGMILSCNLSCSRMIHTSEQIGTRTTVHRGALTGLLPFGSDVGNIHSGTVSCDTVVSSSNVDRSVRMWSVTSRTLLHQINVTAVYWVGVMTEWSLCVGTNRTSGSVSVLDVAKPHEPPSKKTPGGLGSSGSSGIVVHNNKNIGSQQSVTIRGHGGSPITTVCVSLNTFVVVSGSYDGRVCVWCARTGQLLHTMKEESWSTTTAVASNTEGNVIMTGGAYYVGSTQTVRPCLTCWRLMWDTVNEQPPRSKYLQKQERTQSMHVQKVLNNFMREGTIDAMAFCVNEKYFLTATTDYQIRLWNVGGGPKL